MLDKHEIKCVWDDSLEGKRCAVADTISDLETRAMSGAFTEVSDSGSNEYPFLSGGERFRFAYPEVGSAWVVMLDGEHLSPMEIDSFGAKRMDGVREVARFALECDCRKFVEMNSSRTSVIAAYFDGKTIQRLCDDGIWRDCHFPCWDSREYRERPRYATNIELQKWLADGNGQCLLGGEVLCQIQYSLGDDGLSADRGVMVRRWGEREWSKPLADFISGGEK